MPEAARIHVSVAYAEPDRAWQAVVDLPAGATLAAAIVASGIHRARPDVEVSAERVGIFARKAGFDTVLRDGDRVEIYRSLKLDPKEARRLCAQRSARRER